MKKILSGILSLLLVFPAHAENVGIQNEAGKTLANTAGTSTLLATDKQGRLLLSPSIASSPFHLEDAAAASGDAGVFSLAVRNDSIASLTNTDGDYSPIATIASGAVIGAIQSVWTGSSFILSFHSEDTIAASGDAGVAAHGVLQSALSVDAASGDYGNLKLGLDGRLITAPAPAGETWQACGTATASTADVAIKAAVASNRIYVTSITCASSDADNATNLNFKDATTVIAVGGVNQMATTSAGTFTANFPVPLRGTVNTAFNFNTAVSTSSVICCGAGYISVN